MFARLHRGLNPGAYLETALVATRGQLSTHTRGNSGCIDERGPYLETYDGPLCASYANNTLCFGFAFCEEKRKKNARKTRGKREKNARKTQLPCVFTQRIVLNRKHFLRFSCVFDTNMLVSKTRGKCEEKQVIGNFTLIIKPSHLHFSGCVCNM